ncbi:hypothetical protein D3C73_670850 [compost metagenome]
MRQREEMRSEVLASSELSQDGKSSRRGGRGHRGEHQDCGSEQRNSGAQTYRRGRILIFLEQLQVRRATLARQLGEAGFQAIHPVISGELKAIEQVIEDYKYLFDLKEERE